MSALGQRLITAMVLIPLVVGAVLWLQTDQLRWILALLCLIALWEWARLGGLARTGHVVAYLGAATLYFFVVGRVEADGAILVMILPIAAFWIILTPVLMVRRSRPVSQAAKTDPLLLIAGPLIIGVAGVALVALHRMAPMLALFLLVLIWLADSAAYFAGRAFGRHRLAPAISPGKTLEGVLGGLLAAAAAGGIFSWLDGPLSSVPPLAFILLSLLVALVSVTGDLFESLVKRRQGVKDSGGLLPGHGGLLDRIDSVVAAAPVFLAGLLLLGGA